MAFTCFTSPICPYTLSTHQAAPWWWLKTVPSMSQTQEAFLSASWFQPKGWKALPGEPVKLPHWWLRLRRQMAREEVGACAALQRAMWKWATIWRSSRGRIRKKWGRSSTILKDFVPHFQLSIFSISRLCTTGTILCYVIAVATVWKLW